MTRGRFARSIGAGIVLSCGLATGLFGSPSFLQPTAGARLEPGTTVDVTWAIDAVSVAVFDESELVLSLDGGRTFPVRVSRDIAPTSRRFPWRVPTLPTPRARLALRAGSGERSDSETLVLIGPEFEIAAQRSSSLEELFRVSGEWRTRDALPAAASEIPESSLDDRPSEEMRSLPLDERPARPSSPTSPVVESDRATAGAPPTLAPKKTETLLSPTRLLSVPLRQ